MFQSEELKHKQKRSSKTKQNEASTTKLAPTVSQLSKKQGTTSRRDDTFQSHTQTGSDY